MRRVSDPARIIDRKGDLARVAAVGIDPAQLATRPEDDAAAVGGPVHVWIDPAHRPGFLDVLVESIVEFALATRDQILDVELRLRCLAPDEGNHLAVGRRRWPHRSAWPRYRGGHFAGGEVIAFDVE